MKTGEEQMFPQILVSETTNELENETTNELENETTNELENNTIGSIPEGAAITTTTSQIVIPSPQWTEVNRPSSDTVFRDTKSTDYRKSTTFQKLAGKLWTTKKKHKEKTPNSGGKKLTKQVKDSHQVLLSRPSKAHLEDVYTELSQAASKADFVLPSEILNQRIPIQAELGVTRQGSVHLNRHFLFGKMTKPAPKPSLTLEKERDWVVECYRDHKDIIKIEDVKITHNLQVRQSHNTTIQVTKKLNNVIMDSCHGVNLILEGLISSIELVRCEKTKIQVIGPCPSLNVDSCSGITLYVGPQGKSVVITASKSSDMNISFPVDEEDNWVERAVPQQFVHTINDKNKVESKVSDLYR